MYPSLKTDLAVRTWQEPNETYGAKSITSQICVLDHFDCIAGLCTSRTGSAALWGNKSTEFIKIELKLRSNFSISGELEQCVLLIF